MIKPILTAATLSLAAATAAWALPVSQTTLLPTLTSSDLIQVGKKGAASITAASITAASITGYHGGRYHGHHGGRYYHGGRYWGHRYSYRPYGWQTLGCVLVGPVWYCP